MVAFELEAAVKNRRYSIRRAMQNTVYHHIVVLHSEFALQTYIL